MALDPVTPTNTTFASATAVVNADTAGNFRANINAAVATILSLAQTVQAYNEALFGGFFGNGWISGGNVVAGAGLSVTVSPYAAVVGNYISYSAAQVVGGFAPSATSTVFLRQDGTWTLNTTGTVPTTADHGSAVSWGVVTTNASAVTGIGNTRAAWSSAIATAVGAATAGANSNITSLSGLTTPLSLAQGGTGETSAADALTNLGGELSGAATSVMNAHTTTYDHTLIPTGGSGAPTTSTFIGPLYLDKTNGNLWQRIPSGTTSAWASITQQGYPVFPSRTSNPSITAAANTVIGFYRSDLTQFVVINASGATSAP